MSATPSASQRVIDRRTISTSGTSENAASHDAVTVAIGGKLLPTARQWVLLQSCADPRWQLLVSIAPPPRHPTE